MSDIKVINFTKAAIPLTMVSILLVVLSIGALAWKGLNWGLDFTGGTLVELNYSEPPILEDVRRTLADAGFQGATVVNFGSQNDLMVRLQADNANLEDSATTNFGEHIAAILRDASGAQIRLLRSEVVGAQIGEELANTGGLGVLVALALVFVYVALRFQSKFSVGAVASLIHDVILVLGVFALFQLEFDLTVLAALLAVLGYSLNDSIVVSDRIRENFRIMRDMTPTEVMDLSLTQTLGRTIVTSGTTLLVVVVLLVVGGDLIHNFALALAIGISVGTYSSIIIGTAILMWLKLTKEDLMPPVKEGEELEEIP